MREEQRAAERLASSLVARGVAARAEGAGVHWAVCAASAHGREITVPCFWYGPGIAGALSLGMNAANARESRTPHGATPAGDEFMVVLTDRVARAADGRTSDLGEVVSAVCAWLEGATLDEVAARAPFVGRQERRIREVGSRIDPRLRREIAGDPGYEVWVYGDGRSCEARWVDDTLIVAFYLRQARIAHAESLADLAGAVSTWLLDRPAVTALPGLVPGVVLARHAELIEADPARWHWAHMRDRIDNPRDVLAPLRELLIALAASPIASRFYTFSSLNSLCFTASSHYPWVCDGLPWAAPVQGRSAEVDAVVRAIEARLAASTVQPFFGSRCDHECALLREALEKINSPLRPELVQKQAWFHLVVERAPRRCTVSDGGATLDDGAQTAFVRLRSWAEGANWIHRFLVEGAPLGEIEREAASGE